MKKYFKILTKLRLLVGLALVVLSLATALGLLGLSQTVLASDHLPDTIKIEGQQFSPSRISPGSEETGNGWSYNRGHNRLTLNGYNSTHPIFISRGINNNAEVNIHLVGTNVINQSSRSEGVALYVHANKPAKITAAPGASLKIISGITKGSVVHVTSPYEQSGGRVEIEYSPVSTGQTDWITAFRSDAGGSSAFSLTGNASFIINAKTDGRYGVQGLVSNFSGKGMFLNTSGEVRVAVTKKAGASSANDARHVAVKHFNATVKGTGSYYFEAPVGASLSSFNLSGGNHKLVEPDDPTFFSGTLPGRSKISFKIPTTPTYSLPLTCGDGGTCTKSPNKTSYENGETVTVRALANSGYVIDRFTVRGVVVSDAHGLRDYSHPITIGSGRNDINITFKEDGIVNNRVSVINGTATPNSAPQGATINLSAIAAPAGKVFDKWVTDNTGVTSADVNSPNTTFVMPNESVLIRATYKDAPPAMYNVTISGGLSSHASASSGTAVTVTADTPVAGTMFDAWVASDSRVSFDNENSPIATFGMPNGNVIITATYKPEIYSVTAINGTAYPHNPIIAATVRVTADTAPAGLVFDRWTASDPSIVFDDETNPIAFFTMPPIHNVTVKANYKPDPNFAYNVTVTAGSATPSSAVYGATINLIANPAPSGQVFDKWTTTHADVTFADANSPNTTFTMPYGNVAVTATFKPAPPTLYSITVNGGTSDVVTATAGTVVNLTAGVAPSGQVFDRWTTSSAGVTFADASSQSTTFVMPNNDVSISVSYKPAPLTTYSITVNSGSSSLSNASAGTTINISASPAATGYVFNKWISNVPGVVFADEINPNTSFTMPAGDVVITATYSSASSIVPNLTILTDRIFVAQKQDINISMESDHVLPAGAVIEFWLNSDPVKLGEVVLASNSRTLNYRATIPCTVPAGQHRLTARYRSVVSSPVTLTVAEGNCSLPNTIRPNQPGAPRTGFEPKALPFVQLIVAITLLLGGVALRFATNKK